MIPFLMLFTIPLTFAEDDASSFITQFGAPKAGSTDTDGLLYGFGIASVDNDGNVFVTDTAKQQIQKFSPSGEFLAKWGGAGTENGQFVSPGRMAFDSEGNVYVSDRLSHRVQKFTSTGEFIAKWGGGNSLEKNDGQFTNPQYIAVDSKDNVYVSDADNRRIQKFSSEGEFLAKWNVHDADVDDPDIPTPHILSIDSSDNVYVADMHRIQKFSSEGELISKWDTFDTMMNDLPNSFAVAIDFSGNSYVLDSQQRKIAKFSPEGTVLSSQVFTSLGTAENTMRFGLGMTFDKDGSLYAFDMVEFNIKKFDGDGNIIASFGKHADKNTDGQIVSPRILAIDSADNVYVENRNSQILKFSSDGKAVRVMNLANEDNVRITDLTNIVFDSQDNIYVSNQQNRVLKFTNDGEFIKEYDIFRPTSDYRLPSIGITLDGKDNVYAFSNDNSKDDIIQKFTNDGELITTWEHSHDRLKDEPRQEMAPTAIAADNDDNVYVAYRTSHIQKFSSDGEFITDWKSPESGNGQFFNVYAMTADSKNNIYAMALENDKIMQFSSDGEFITEWGSSGDGDDQFLGIGGIAIDSDDNVYVSDYGNDRIQKFSKDYTLSKNPAMSQSGVDDDAVAGKDLPEQLSPPSPHIDDLTLDVKPLQTQDTLDSPLKQIKSDDVSPENVRCNLNLELILKYDGSPACVKPETKTILVERWDGWTANIGAHDAVFKDTELEIQKIPLPVYPRFENGITEIVNPDHESLEYRATSPVIDDAYLSNNVQQWKDASPDELQAEHEKYDDDEFYTELGRLLMKNEMQHQMNELGIVNVQDDFEVISGMMLTSFPPHIGFSSIIHATDGHYYWLQGGTHANQVNYYKTTQLQYPNPTEIDFGSRVSPDVIPQVSILQKVGDGENDLKSVPPFTVLHQPGDVEFYNDAPGTLTVYLTKDGLEEFLFENSQKIVIQSKSDAVWSFADPGSYSWRGKVPAMIEGNEYNLNTGGSILVLSDDMGDLSKEEKMETAKMMLITSSLPITGIGQQGEEYTLFINLSPAISELLPESKQYYLETAQKLIPFEDVSIILDE